jgi:hypothetical protein
MISYPEFLENLEEYKNKYSDSRGSLQYRNKTEIMLIQNLIFRKEVVKFFIEKIFSIKRINEKRSYTIFGVSENSR